MGGLNWPDENVGWDEMAGPCDLFTNVRRRPVGGTWRMHIGFAIDLRFRGLDRGLVGGREDLLQVW